MYDRAQQREYTTQHRPANTKTTNHASSGMRLSKMLADSVSPTERSLAVASVGADGTLYLKPHRSPVAAPPPSPSLDPQRRSRSPLLASSIRSSPYSHHNFDRLSAAHAFHGSPRHDTDVPSLSSQSCTASSISSDAGSIAESQRIQANPAHLSSKTPPSDSPMLLQVAIPSHRLGKPTFSNRGTLCFHDSYVFDVSSYLDSGHSTVPATLAAHLDDVGQPQSAPAISPLVYSRLDQDRGHPTHINFGANGQILAATPSRLVAQITHADFLDYDLLADFFLTYRLFLDSKTLLRYLIARLEQAVSHKIYNGPVIRVRTFVAIRHWILNYFLDDFEPDHDLRVLFCQLVNALAQKLSRRSDRGGGDLKVITELKKCWRQTCAVIWDSTDGDRPSDDLTPGMRPFDKTEISGIQRPFASRPEFPEVRRTTSSANPFNAFSTTPLPLVARSDSYDAASCSIPMWGILGRSLPSFRPRTVLTESDPADTQSSDVWRLSAMVNCHKRGKSSKSSTGRPVTSDKKNKNPRQHTPTTDLGEFDSGLLIRGMLLAPALPSFPVSERSAPPPVADLAPDSKDGAMNNIVDHVKQRLKVRDGSPGKKIQWVPQNWKPIERPTVADTIVTTQSDRLASDVAETYGQLIREETQKQPAMPEALRAASSHGAATAKAPRPPSTANPSYVKRRQSSHVTCSSQSIMIINDTWDNNFNIHDLVVPPEFDIWNQHSRQPPASAQDKQASGRVSPPFGLFSALPGSNRQFSRPTLGRNATGSTRRPSTTIVPSLTLRKPSFGIGGSFTTGDVASIQSQEDILHLLSTQASHAYFPFPDQNVTSQASKDNAADGGIDFALAKLEGRITTPETKAISPDQSPLLQPTIYDPDQSVSDQYVGELSGLGLIPLPLSPRGKKAATEAEKSSNAGSSFLLDEDQSLSDDEREKSHTRHVRSKASQSISEGSYFMDREEEDGILTPTAMGFCASPYPPPSSPLPALPQTPPSHEPIPWKAAQRIRTPGPVIEFGKASPKQSHVAKFSMATRTDDDCWTPSPSSKDNLKSGPRYKASPYIGPLSVLSDTHTPFILAFSSEALAAQFTLIERDALSEIDWKELIETRWSDSTPAILNWADYMRVPGQTGIDIVTTRFNLVVKWAISEIVLTSTPALRAATITKLIHIASHARQLRNFATAYQLTTALLSSSIARLKQTWALVPAAEKSSLASLERLVSPTRNFAALRAETDQALVSTGAGSGGAGGPLAARSRPGACIPFLGIYTHDLASIAQRPARLPGGADNEQVEEMVNFERFAATAAAVKGLLGLLEASGRYALAADRELVARCLWLGALAEEEIEARSRGLQAEEL